VSSFDQKVIEDIEKYGCHVVSVLEYEEDDIPTFTYSVGIYETTEKPELIVMGLKHSLAQSMVNRYNRRLKDGEIFEIGKYYSGFISGFDVCFIEVDDEYFEEFPLGCVSHYDNKEFKLLQLIWPSTNGVWPWDEDAPDFYQWSQPLLNKTGVLNKI